MELLPWSWPFLFRPACFEAPAPQFHDNQPSIPIGGLAPALESIGLLAAHTPSPGSPPGLQHPRQTLLAHKCLVPAVTLCLNFAGS